MNWASARSSARQRAPQHGEARLGDAWRRARSRGCPSASPTSSCGFGAKANSRGVAPAPDLDVVVVALARRHRGMRQVRDLEQRAPRCRSSTSLSSASSALMRSADLAHLLAISARDPRRRRLAWPMASEARLRSALRSSTSANEPASLGVAGEDFRTSSAPPLSASARSHRVGLLADQLEVQHGRPRGFRRGRRSRPRRARSSPRGRRRRDR